MAETLADTLRQLGARMLRILTEEKHRNRSPLEVIREELARQGIDPSGEKQNAITLLFAAFWAMSGFAYVAVGHTLSASLMATDPPEDVEDLDVPWPAFIVGVPNGLIPGDPAEFIGIARRSDSSDAMVLIGWRAGNRYSAWFGSIRELSENARHAGADVILLYRLLIGVILELDAPKASGTLQSPPKQPKTRRQGELPRVWVYRLVRDVKVDCRPWVQAFVQSGGKSPSVQRLTRGHQRRVVVGPGRAGRRWQRIEPYWKGSVDAPIATSRHVLATKRRP